MAKRLVLTAVLVLAGLTACNDGKLTVDEEKLDDGFGSVKSAVLVHDKEAGGDGYYVILSNRGGLCKDLQALLPEQYALSDEYEQAWDDFSEVLFDWTNPDYMDAVNAALADLCEAQTAYLTGLKELYDDFIGDGDHMLTLYFWNDDDYNIFPEEGVTYEAEASSSEDGFEASLTYYFGNPYAPVLDAWDEDACKSLDPDQMAAAFDDIWDAMDDVQDWWYQDEGELTISKAGDTKISADFSGDLKDLEGNDAGAIEGSFTAKVCEIE